MTAERERSGWAVGWTVYAGIMMLILGFFHAFAGLVGILQDDLYVMTNSYVLQLDATTWGWIHMVAGVIVLMAGLGVLSGATWARIVGVTVAVLSTITNFMWLPWYPVWGIIMIVANAFVIWALTVHGTDVTT
jgi:hypothetical protein